MKKSLITMIVALCLVAALGVGATMAYLTDSTDTVTNTFTVGKVDIDLAETVNESSGLKGFDYKNVIPTATYDKEPIVTVKKDSVASYVFVEVTNENGDNLTIEDYNTTVFTKLSDGVYYKQVDATTADTALAPIFTTVKVGSNVTEKTTLKNITIKAYAIQQEGFADAEAAWTAVKAAATSTNG